jgi:hypothetical protein
VSIVLSRLSCTRMTPCCIPKLCINSASGACSRSNHTQGLSRIWYDTQGAIIHKGYHNNKQQFTTCCSSGRQRGTVYPVSSCCRYAAKEHNLNGTADLSRRSQAASRASRAGSEGGVVLSGTASLTNASPGGTLKRRVREAVAGDPD